MRKPHSVFVLSPNSHRAIYGEIEIERIRSLTHLYDEVVSNQDIHLHREALQQAEVIFSGWGAPLLDEKFLDLTPNLKLFLYGAGSVKDFTTEALFERGIRLCNAAAINAIPVVEYTLAQIILSLKRVWQMARMTRERKTFWSAGERRAPGNYHSVIGLISLGSIGLQLVERLTTFDLDIIAYDPYVDQEVFDRYGIRRVGLDEIFQQANVISLHTPWLPETERMIRGHHFRLMLPDATFINTSRGAIVYEDEMVTVLEERQDILAILDVTHPEPPVASSPLYTLPNVVLTPHIAGSMGKECQRMGASMIDELERYLRGEALHLEVTLDMFEKMGHAAKC